MRYKDVSIKYYEYLLLKKKRKEQKDLDLQVPRYSTRKQKFSRKMFRIVETILNKKKKKNTFFASKIYKKLTKSSIIEVRKPIRRNILRRSYFWRLTRKSYLRTLKKDFFTNFKRVRIKIKRSLVKKPKLTKFSRIERRFLKRLKSKLIETKRYLYRKKFPKIRGRKNRNFNFDYYNNIYRLPQKFYIGRFYITYLANNTFINIHDNKKMLKVVSAGKIGFRGPKRSIPFSRQSVARRAIQYLSKSHINILDVYFNSNYSRWYYLMVKEFHKPKAKTFYIRYLIINNARPHGWIRAKKERRK